MLIFSFEGEPVAAWDAQSTTLHVMEAASVLDPDDPTWVKIAISNNPSLLPGSATYAPSTFRNSPIRVDGLDYPNAAQAAANGKGSANGLEFTTSRAVDVSGVWSKVWEWNDDWSAEEGDYTPPVFDPENP